ncbi:MFS transporter [Beauveria brongniartii RCEF 3172]|uniref:MFS transporter n=1 Tax=Beauveria brongniartii RCEF 3172 TaxID=1081107 RepID=A0A169YF13_9HYPO|nr:MFS transporter [Beauveria brongniartii RCEF 3172]
MAQPAKQQNERMIVEEEYSQKQVPQVEKVDYSGAHEKTDPKEIALVKKLDRWIMASP